MDDATGPSKTRDGYDDELFRQIGKAVVTFSRVEGLVRDAMSGLTGASPEVTALLTKNMTAGTTTRQALTLAKALPESPARDRLIGWLKDVSNLVDKRNDLIHSDWVAISDGSGWLPVKLAVKVTDGRPFTMTTVVTAEDVAAVRTEFGEVLGRAVAALGPFLPSERLNRVIDWRSSGGPSTCG